MKAIQPINYEEEYSPLNSSVGEGFAYFIVKADVIHNAGKVIPRDKNLNSPISSIRKIIGDELGGNIEASIVILFDLGIEDICVDELIDFSRNETMPLSFHILWNSSRISFDEMQHLLQLGIVDDFIDDIQDSSLIRKKVQFLIKYKQSNKTPRLLDVNRVKALEGVDARTMVFKRLFDISVSLVLLILLIPLFIFVGLAIKIETRGPIFYVSKRVGRHYRIFPMIKFRSMYDGADQSLSEISHLNMYGNESESAAFVKIKNDPRVSEVGKFLRKTSIDEFPQLLNVLMGHMSIVGNRPLPLYEAEKLLVNDFVSRFDAPAGITGLWQVIKKEKPDMDEQDRIHLDIRYSKECSFLNDLWIIMKTPGALLQNQNY